MGKENIPNWRSDLRNALNKYFSEDDLSVIAFDLGLKLDTIVSFNKNKTQRLGTNRSRGPLLPVS